jgi:hypothetical protein
VHDITEFEGAGIPSVLAASSEFEGAVQAQGSALGFKPAVVYVPHPIQDRTDSELRALADRAMDQLLANLTRNFPALLGGEGQGGGSDGIGSATQR